MGLWCVASRPRYIFAGLECSVPALSTESLENLAASRKFVVLFVVPDELAANKLVVAGTY